jgi:hypothetical protein
MVEIILKGTACKCNNFINKRKVKVTLKQATKAQRGSRGIALLFL